MDELEKILLEASRQISEKVAKGFVGDSLNLINICTMYREYLPEKSSTLSRLFDGIKNLPKSLAADTAYDVILRASSATLLGFDQIIDYTDLFPLDSDDGEKSKHERATDFLYHFWQKKPLELAINQFSLFLLGQYFYRLQDRGAAILEKDRYAITHQMLGFLPSLIREAQNEEMTFYRLIDQLLFGAVICYKLDVEHIGRTFFSIFRGNLPRFMEDVAKAENVKGFVENNVESIGFMLYNLSLLPDTMAEEIAPIRNTFKKLALSEFYLKVLFEHDLRINAIALQGLKSIIEEPLRKKISNELNSVCDFSALVEMKRLLEKSIEYRAKLDKLLDKNGFPLTSQTVKDIHQFIQKIKFKSIDSLVHHPVNTVESMKGDCKAISTLVALLALEQGIRGKVCLYIGDEFDAGNNHIYIELFDDELEKYVIVDHGAELGHFHKCVENPDYIIKYPLNSLLKNKENEFLDDIYAKRQRIIEIFQDNA